MHIYEEALSKIDGWEQAIQCLFMRLGPEWEESEERTAHYHEYIELLYGMEGQAQVLIGERLYPMGPGDLLLINAHEVHDVRIHKGLTCYFVVKFLPEILYAKGQSLTGLRYFLPLWQKEMLFSPVLPAKVLEKAGIDAVLKNMMAEEKGRQVGFELALEADILRLFTWILRERCPRKEEGEAKINGELKKALEHALFLAQENFAEWGVRDAARACGLSYSYFSRSFKEAFGMSFVAYLEELRLAEAERMLLTGDADISEIAMRTGFGTVSYFIACFRRKYGTTPKKFRIALHA